MGRCVTVVDNGEERLSHQRFDVVIDSLQFDPRGQQVFEHILTLNGTGEGEEAVEGGSYGETAPSYAEDASFEDVSADFTGSKIEIPQAPSYQEYAEEEATVIGDSQAFAGSAAVGSDLPPRAAAAVVSAPPPPPATPSYAPVDEEQDELIDETPATPRAAATYSDPPTGARGSYAEAAAPGTHVNGAVFSYPQGLTFPDKPPRPELDATRRVSRAPRPR